MKKVLSVLLAAAMVMGMSVTSMAADNKSWTSGASGKVTEAVNTVIAFDDYVHIVRNGAVVMNTAVSDDYFPAGTALSLQPGDVLYFPLINVSGTNAAQLYTGTIDSNWSINIKSNGYVDAASYYTVPTTGTNAGKTAWGTTGVAGAKYVKVEIADDYNSTSSTTIKFYMYIADGDVIGATTEEIKVECSFANIGVKDVDFDFTNDADVAATWLVAKNKKGTAVFDFDDDVYFTVKMISEEKVVLNLSTAYDKDIDADYNEYDADLDFYNFKGSKDNFTKVGELFIPADEDTFIYEVVDGELVAVEAEYVEDYKVGNYKKVDGWMIETDELGYYVVADEELVVAEEEVEVEAPVVEDNKANPETGANDFVGAAVALAVVSVAAAGALALKK